MNFALLAMSLTDLTPYASCLCLFIAVVLAVSPVFQFWNAVTDLYLWGMMNSLESTGLRRERLYIYSRFLVLAIVLTVVGGILLDMYILAFIVALLLAIVPRTLLQGRIARRRALLRNQLAAACTGLASSARAGMSLPQALTAVAQDSPEPIKSELWRICRDYRGGVPLPEAIGRASERLELDTFSIFAISLITCLENGGKITDMLDKISRNINEVQRLERRMLSETAAARRVVWVLAIFPFVFLAVMGVLHSSGTALMFTTIVGQCLLVTAIIFIGLSILWSRSILSLEV
ncbi:type II secretion system F family protein [Lignipirellula cremea]|uniref:Bacterial type II secretion system protein F domain protein n=1 Tax=Lignipirellula cremea TaxID=2528010 RepID=A0A518E0R8_9BACT|nr:type II secretion system F family protein [Lignipirellula cremea]QDU97685.1 Bacterial type II secretion system protein F domain protein [Lignipirellula cremea]